MIVIDSKFGPTKGFEVNIKKKFRGNKKSPEVVLVRHQRTEGRMASDAQTQLFNPINCQYDFGYLVCPASRGNLPIRCFVGFHNSVKSGYGLKHIWSSHSDHLIGQGYLDISETSSFLGAFFARRPSVFFESQFRLRVRVSVVDDVMGTVILEARRTYGRPCWSVVTAHQGINKYGKFVGSVKPSRTN
ncbi:hypothetical protein LCGC14_1903500 [marine sediment metagenome]|uniref:Uncharacterized protein n=1 Tax=marine sediment metagenome TaxID=412755 RepID=A0A0F9ITX5_9ZZZZ|tara:strand:+ start:248 stop:811 length:564 start_codon:yes stop_codon:yes gene_type:complete